MTKDNRWPHDCPDCQYLGSTRIESYDVDGYRCHDTVVLRYGYEGSAYWSMLESMLLSVKSSWAFAARDLLSRDTNPIKAKMEPQ